MNSQWQDFLTEQGAQFDEIGRVTTFGHPDIERFLVKNGPVVANLSEQALLKVEGEEAFDFLQGQFTNDLKTVNESSAQYSAYCEPQGKVLAIFLVFLHKNAYYLSFDADLKASVMQRLTMFKLRSKVTIEDVTDTWAHLGFGGDFADLALQRHLNTKLKDIYGVTPLDDSDASDVLAIKVPGPYHTYRLLGPSEQMMHVWKNLRNNAEATNSFDWNLLNIVAGQPTLTAETSNQFIAQFLNLDKLGAINFQKGCFPGQEIIARMHYRGKVTKRMLRLHISGEMTITPGMELKLQSGEKTFTFNVINAAADVYEGMVALAITSLKPLESYQGDLSTEAGLNVSIEPLPYDLSEE